VRLLPSSTNIAATTHDHKEVTMKTQKNETTTTAANLQPTVHKEKENFMKKHSFTSLALAVVFAMFLTFPLSATAQDEVVGGPGTTYQNPLQLALKAWYPANLSAVLGPPNYTFSSPGGIVFDGSNIWVEHVVSGGPDKLDKIQVSDGKLVGTYTVGTAGTTASPSAFDGVNIWSPDHTQGSSTIYRTVAATGLPANPASCNLGSGQWPDSAAFDGQYMWVSTNNGYVVKVNANNCTISCSANLGGRLYDLAYDGHSMWVTAVYSNEVFKLNSNCTQAPGSPYAVGAGPIGIVFDGSNMWTANQVGQSVSRISSTGTVTSYSLGYTPWEIRYDGANLWVTDYTSGKVSIMSATNPASNPPAYETCGSLSSSPLGLAFDGANMWVGCEGINAIGKM